MWWGESVMMRRLSEEEGGRKRSLYNRVRIAKGTL